MDFLPFQAGKPAQRFASPPSGGQAWLPLGRPPAYVWLKNGRGRPSASWARVVQEKPGAVKQWRRRLLRLCNTLFGGGVFAFFDISGILMRSLNCVWAPEHNRKWVLRFYSEGFTTAPCLWQVNSAKDKGSDWTTSPFGHSLPLPVRRAPWKGGELKNCSSAKWNGQTMMQEF